MQGPGSKPGGKGEDGKTEARGGSTLVAGPLLHLRNANFKVGLWAAWKMALLGRVPTDEAGCRFLTPSRLHAGAKVSLPTPLMFSPNQTS